MQSKRHKKSTKKKSCRLEDQQLQLLFTSNRMNLVNSFRVFQELHNDDDVASFEDVKVRLFFVSMLFAISHEWFIVTPPSPTNSYLLRTFAFARA